MNRAWWLRAGRWLALTAFGGAVLFGLGLGQQSMFAACFGTLWLGCAAMGFLIEWSDCRWRD